MFSEIEKFSEKFLVATVYISIVRLEQSQKLSSYEGTNYLFRDKRTVTASRRTSEMDISKGRLAVMV